MASPSTTMVVVGGVSGFFGGGALEESPSCDRVGAEVCRGARGACQNGCCGRKKPPNGSICCCGIARCGRGGRKNGSPQNCAAAGDGISTPAVTSMPAPARPSAARASPVDLIAFMRTVLLTGRRMLLAGFHALAPQNVNLKMAVARLINVNAPHRLTAMFRRHGTRVVHVGALWLNRARPVALPLFTTAQAAAGAKRWRPSSEA